MMQLPTRLEMQLWNRFEEWIDVEKDILCLTKNAPEDALISFEQYKKEFMQ